MLIGDGKMVGDHECFQKSTYQTTLRCETLQASVYCIQRDEIQKIFQSHDEASRIVYKEAYLQHSMF